MPAWMGGELLFYTGIALIAIAATGGIISAIILRIAKGKLNKQLDTEFGSRH